MGFDNIAVDFQRVGVAGGIEWNETELNWKTSGQLCSLQVEVVVLKITVIDSLKPTTGISELNKLILQ